MILEYGVVCGLVTIYVSFSIGKSANYDLHFKGSIDTPFPMIPITLFDLDELTLCFWAKFERLAAKDEVFMSLVFISRFVAHV